MSQYVLFYSKKCKNSISFLNILHKINARRYFIFISVDRENGCLNPAIRKFQITHVPTIIANDQFYVGYNAILWLKNIISDMGLKGPHTIDSRQNKETCGENYNRISETNQDQDQEGFSGFDPTLGNMLSIDNDMDNKINFVPEDGQNHNRRGDYQIPHQSILPPEKARECDIDILRSSNGGKKGNDTKRRTRGLKGDSLKEKQYNNEFERYIQERDSDIPMPRSRI